MVEEVKLRRKYLNSGDVFILDLGLHLIQVRNDSLLCLQSAMDTIATYMYGHWKSVTSLLQFVSDSDSIPTVHFLALIPSSMVFIVYAPPPHTYTHVLHSGMAKSQIKTRDQRQLSTLSQSR